MTSFVFVSKGAAESLLRAPGATSFMLVTAETNVSDEELAARLREVPGIEVLTTRTMVNNDLKLLSRFFSAPLRLMVGIAFLIGALVVGLVIYTATVERHREYGVLKAIGIRNRHLYRIVVAQALLTAGIGAVVGLGLALLSGRVIETLRPQFLVAIEPDAVIWVLVGGLGMALLAALTPALLVARLAPSDVLRRAA
jgi:putative ABC transport system permease protein